MAVYVDLAGHMVADRLAELHEFAAKMGVPQSQFQGDKHPRYDLASARMLQQAVDAGARQVSPKHISRICARLRGHMRWGIR